MNAPLKRLVVNRTLATKCSFRSPRIGAVQVRALSSGLWNGDSAVNQFYYCLCVDSVGRKAVDFVPKTPLFSLPCSQGEVGTTAGNRRSGLGAWKIPLG